TPKIGRSGSGSTPLGHPSGGPDGPAVYEAGSWGRWLAGVAAGPPRLGSAVPVTIPQVPANGAHARAHTVHAADRRPGPGRTAPPDRPARRSRSSARRPSNARVPAAHARPPEGEKTTVGTPPASWRNERAEASTPDNGPGTTRSNAAHSRDAPPGRT